MFQSIRAPEVDQKSGQQKFTHLRLDIDAPGSIADLLTLLRFVPDQGRIWLDTQRVMMVHHSTFASLRRELVDTLGFHKARGFMTRMGYASGVRDAELVQKIKPQGDQSFFLGPQLRAIQGVTLMNPVRVEADVAAGRFYAEFTWSESFEADYHIAAYGLVGEPVCWIQAGYASGYASTLMARQILFREVECRGMGAVQCRIIGKPIEEWDEVEDALRALQPEQFVNRFVARRSNGDNPLYQLNKTRVGGNKDVELVGASADFISTCHKLQKVSKTNATVLFLGETGVGKEIFARALHQISARADGPFVAVNCAAIPENLIEAELFGVEKGAFTGAQQSRAGRFQRADRGTLFLDEVGTLDVAMQAKLLRAIQEREVEAVGSSHVQSVDVRIIAATNLDLEEAVKKGEFRSDLLYRLCVFPIVIPPLRNRRDDVPLLMDYFLRKFTTQYGRCVTGFTARAVDALYCYEYPGNIRELENIIERAVIMAEDNQPIDLANLSLSSDFVGKSILHLATGNASARAANIETQDIFGEQSSILDQLRARGQTIQGMQNTLMAKAAAEAFDAARGNVSAAARMLGITRAQLTYWLKKRGSQPTENQWAAARYLQRLIHAIGLDEASVEQAEPQLYQSMQQKCIECEDCERCDLDLTQGTSGLYFRDYCPNSDILVTLQASLEAH